MFLYLNGRNIFYWLLNENFLKNENKRKFTVYKSREIFLNNRSRKFEKSIKYKITFFIIIRFKIKMLNTDKNNNMPLSSSTNFNIKLEPFNYYCNYYNDQFSNSKKIMFQSLNINQQQENIMDLSSCSSNGSSTTMEYVNQGLKKTSRVSANELSEEVVATRPLNRGGRKQVKIGTSKRNARERNRVRFINNCFEVLREHLPQELIANFSQSQINQQKNQKLSKVETLRLATLYIKNLTDLLNSGSDYDIKQQEMVKSEENNFCPVSPSSTSSSSSVYNYNSSSSSSTYSVSSPNYFYPTNYSQSEIFFNNQMLNNNYSYYSQNFGAIHN
jgi:hypothetical protein